MNGLLTFSSGIALSPLLRKESTFEGCLSDGDGVGCGDAKSGDAFYCDKLHLFVTNVGDGHHHGRSFLTPCIVASPAGRENFKELMLIHKGTFIFKTCPAITSRARIC